MADAPAVPAADPKPSLLAVIAGIVASGTFRRLLVFALGFAVVALNSKLGLNLDADAIAGTVVTVALYLLQSAGKEAIGTLADAKVQAAGAAAAANPAAALSK